MNNSLRRFMRKYATQLLLLAVLVILCAVLSVASDSFLNLKNAKNILEAITFRLILAVGMSFVVASGGIDLSAGSMVSLCGVLTAMALKAGCPAWAALILALLLGIVLGGANGAVIHHSHLSPFIVTLSTASLYRGLSLILTLGIPVSLLPQDFLFFGRSDVDKLNPPLVMAALVFAIGWVVLFRTKWGSYILALGGNAEALRRSGVRCVLYRTMTYAISGMTAALTAVITIARLNSAEANAGLNMELDAITAVIMGGTLLSGGKASLWGTFIAVLLLGVIRNGLTILSISPYYQQFLIGVLLLFSVLFAEWRRRRAS